MTKEEIMKLKDGEEIDNLVAEKVMGWHKGFYTSNLDGRTYTSDSESWLDADGHYMHGIGRYPEYDEENFHTIDWHPSQSILWAWEVVEKLVEKIPVYFDIGHEGDGQKTSCVHFNHHYPPFLKIEVSADTMPLAICRAALLTVEDE